MKTHVRINCKRTQERSEKKPAYLASEDEKVSTASEIKLPRYKKTVFSLNLCQNTPALSNCILT